MFCMPKKDKNKSKKNLPQSLKLLLDLIRTMPPAQKRAFKRDSGFWTSRDKGLNYIALFDLISKFSNLEQKDDRDLAPYIHKHNIEFSEQNLSALSSYLYDRILQSMRFVATGSKTFKDLNGLMQDIHFLYNNSLRQACLSKIEEAKKLALEIDRPAYLLELTNMERRILPYMNLPNILERLEAINKLDTESREILGKYNEVYISMYDNWTFISKNVTFTEGHNQKFHELEQTYENSIRQSSSPRLKMAYLTLFEQKNIGNFNFKLINQESHIQKANDLRSQIVTLTKENPCLKEDDYPSYVESISQYLINLLKEKKYDKVIEELKELETTDDEFFRCQSLAFVQLQLFNQQNRFEEGYQYLQTYNIAHNLNLYQSQISSSRLMVMRFLGAYIVLALEKYKDLTVWANQLIKDPNFSIRFELRLSGHLLNAIAYYELNPANNIEAADLLDQMMRRIRLKKIELTTAQMAVLKDIKNLFSKYLLEHHNKENLKTWTQQAESVKGACGSTPMMSSFIVPLSWLLSRLKGTTIIQELN